MLKKTLAALACLIVTAAGAQAEELTKEQMFGYTPPNVEAAAGMQVFTKCKKCHSMDPSRNTYGPNLRGIFMRKAATLPRFDYSDNLKASGIIWDEANLLDWIKGNTWLVRGSRMRHVQITDPAEQDYLIAFLKTFK